jgi:hypothetical protein
LEFKGIEDLDITKCISYLQEEKKYKLILLETGISTLEDLYNQEDINANPIDTLFLSIYRGEVRRCMLDFDL